MSFRQLLSLSLRQVIVSKKYQIILLNPAENKIVQINRIICRSVDNRAGFSAIFEERPLPNGIRTMQKRVCIEVEDFQVGYTVFIRYCH